MLAELSREGVTHAAMEASSHGLDQHRLDGVKLAAAAFTNLGRDHMDYHPTVEHLFGLQNATLQPAAQGAPAVIFADDAYSLHAIEAAGRAGCEVLTVGRKGTFLTLKRVEHFRHKQMAEIHCGADIYEVDIPLAGDFQVAMRWLLRALPCPRASARLRSWQRSASWSVPRVGLNWWPHGRWSALAYVDYAHKPDALENVLTSVRPFTTGRVIVVFGWRGS